MHLQTLTGEKIRIIKAQAALAAESCWYLAGGSALALHLGHRTSRDLDWFSEKTFDQQALRQALQKTRASNILLRADRPSEHSTASLRPVSLPNQELAVLSSP